VHLETTPGTQPSAYAARHSAASARRRSDCRGVSIASSCSVNAAFLFPEPRMFVVVPSCSRDEAEGILLKISARDSKPPPRVVTLTPRAVALIFPHVSASETSNQKSISRRKPNFLSSRKSLHFAASLATDRSVFTIKSLRLVS